jgi:sirohydrochlorin cobaltochelatase
MNETQTPRREVIDNPDGTVTEYSDFEPTEAAMQRLADLLFKEHWGEITVGPCIEGAVFEIRFKDPPKVSLFDGYLTVDLGHWHFHLCIGTHQGAPSPELAAKRRVARAAFFETRGGKCGGGRSWGLRLWNGFGEQMTTVFLPSPFLSDDLRIPKEPQWERLQLWYELRQRFLGEPMPEDMSVARDQLRRFQRASLAGRAPTSEHSGDKTGLLIVGHGSRDHAANAEFEALVTNYRATRPAFDIAHGYVELARPALPEALRELARRCEHVVALPLFLFAAGHVKNDLPLALAQARREFPGHRFTVSRALGVHPDLVGMAFERAQSLFESAPAKAAVVVVGRGSSDPDANGDFYKAVRLIGEGRDFGWVVPSFIGIARPLFKDAIELLARARPERIVVVPYFLFAGRLIEKLSTEVAAFRERHRWIRTELAPHLGRDERLCLLIDERVQEALKGTRPLPCDNCQYRVPVAGVADKVGGLKALLWSLRHGFTHTQAMPHVHAHRALKKHVLICGNVDCAERGSVSLITALRRLLKAAGSDRDIRVTRTHCMGRCGEGPTVAVYPDGIWYRRVREADAEELVREHLLGDRLVSRLVDNIMQ